MGTYNVSFTKGAWGTYTYRQTMSGSSNASTQRSISIMYQGGGDPPNGLDVTVSVVTYDIKKLNFYTYRHTVTYDITISGMPNSYLSTGTYVSMGYVTLSTVTPAEGDNAFTFNISISDPVVYYTHTINYNPGSAGSGSMSATTVTDTNSGNTNVTFASNGYTPPTGGGYYFAGWRINDTGTVYQPGNTYPVGGNGAVTAYAYWLRRTYTITTSVSPSGTGTVTGGGTYYQGDPVTLTATPASHYHFVNWSDGTTSNPYSMLAGGDLSLTANFAIDTFTVSASVDPSGTGSVSGTGTYNYGTTATLTATPAANYKFDHWSDSTTTNPKTFTVSGDVSLTAYFVLDTVQVTGASNGNGSVTGSGTYTIGSTATLTAVPDSHYKFVQWDDDTTANPKVFTVTQAVTYTATFAYAYPNMPVKVNGNWVDGTPWVKVNGEWVKAVKVWYKDNGTWKESMLEP